MAYDPSILALQKMFTEAQEAAGDKPDSDSEDDSSHRKPGVSTLGPGDLGPQKKPDTKANSTPYAKKNTKEIWEEEEVEAGQEFDDIYDPRPQPEYDINYQQAITTEDMYLQMGNKTPATSSCETMVVKIKLPCTKMADVTLDCKDTFLDCRTPKYKLGLHLPHPTDSKNGKAQWDGKKEILSVTLRMKRDFDFMNF